MFTISSLEYPQTRSLTFFYDSFSFKNLKTPDSLLCHFSLCCLAILVFSSSLKVLVLEPIKESFEDLHKFLEPIMECKLLKPVKFIDMKQEAGMVMVIMKFM